MADQKAILGTLAVIFLASILFTYQGSEKATGLMFIGILFGALWFFKK